MSSHLASPPEQPLIRVSHYNVFNPATGAIAGSAPLCGKEEAEAAVERADEAWRGWRALDVGARARKIEAGLEAVASSKSDLSALLTQEQGKPLHEAQQELDGFRDKMRSFLRLGMSVPDGRIVTLPSLRAPSYGQFASVPDGVTVGLVAWNYPVALIAKKAGPALIGGCTVILKPAFTAPLSALRLVELMNLELPPGVLQCVTGRGKDVGMALIRHPAVRRVHLTGTDDTGKAVSAAGLPDTELLLELAGSDPMIVLSDADIGKALQAAVIGRFRNCGQTCSAVKRLYVDTPIYDEFVGRLVPLVERLAPGNGLEPASAPFVRIGPLHSSEQLQRIEAQLHDAVSRGAEVLTGGRRPPGAKCSNGHFFEPTVVANVPGDSRLVLEEVFGPVLPVFRTSGIEDAIEKANASDWDLNASLWTGDRSLAREVGPRIRCRQLWVNRLPFGLNLRDSPELIAEHHSSN